MLELFGFRGACWRCESITVCCVVTGSSPCCSRNVQEKLCYVLLSQTEGMLHVQNSQAAVREMAISGPDQIVRLATSRNLRLLE